MKFKIILASIALVITNPAIAGATDNGSLGIPDDDVFGTPTPAAFNYPTTKAGKSDRLPKAYDTAPPQIPHKIDSYLPITMGTNDCLDCHDNPKLIGKKYKKGKKLPMPESHYGGFGGKGAKDQVSGARYNCTQCHVPQSGARPLVENTFK